MRHKIVTGPEDDLLGLEQLRAHLRVGVPGQSHPDDNLIRINGRAATAWAEKVTGLALVPQTWETAYDAWPWGGMALPGGVVHAIDSITYLNPFGTSVVLSASDYYVDDFDVPAKVYLTGTAPTTINRPNAIRVRYTVGVETQPPDIIAAVLLMVGHLYENRETSTAASGRALELLPEGARKLLAPHRVDMGV